MDEINEGSDTVVTIGFKDEAGDPVTPSALSYTIKDFYSDTLLVPETSDVPTSSNYDVELGPDANVIVNTLYAYEVRIITLEYTYGADKIKTDEYWYKVINMAGYPFPEVIP